MANTIQAVIGTIASAPSVPYSGEDAAAAQAFCDVVDSAGITAPQAVTGRGVTGKDVSGKDVSGKDATGKDTSGKDVKCKAPAGNDPSGKGATAAAIPSSLPSPAPLAVATSTDLGTQGAANLVPTDVAVGVVSSAIPAPDSGDTDAMDMPGDEPRDCVDDGEGVAVDVAVPAAIPFHFLALLTPTPALPAATVPQAFSAALPANGDAAIPAPALRSDAPSAPVVTLPVPAAPIPSVAGAAIPPTIAPQAAPQAVLQASAQVGPMKVSQTAMPQTPATAATGDDLPAGPPNHAITTTPVDPPLTARKDAPVPVERGALAPLFASVPHLAPRLVPASGRPAAMADATAQPLSDAESAVSARVNAQVSTLPAPGPTTAPALPVLPQTGAAPDADPDPDAGDDPLTFAPDAGTLLPTDSKTPQQTPAPVSLPDKGPLQTTAAAVPMAALPRMLAQLARSGGAQPVGLQLDPIELGTVAFNMDTGPAGLIVTIIADRPETLDLLRRHADQFLADLRQSGFMGASLQFGQSGQNQTAQGQFGQFHFGQGQNGQAQNGQANNGQAQNSQPQHGQAGGEYAALAAPFDMPTGAVRSQRTGGLNLRL